MVSYVMMRQFNILTELWHHLKVQFPRISQGSSAP